MAVAAPVRPVLTPAYRLVFRLAIANRPGMFAEVAGTIGARGCSLGAIDLVEATPTTHVRDVTVDCPDEATGWSLAEDLHHLDGVQVRAASDRTFLMHLGGKVEMRGRVSVRTRDDLSLVYTPGVARVCTAIEQDPERAWTLTMRANTVGIVSDGSATLGLGDVGPAAALPVMEGKALLFAQLAGITGIPLVLDTKDPDEIVRTVEILAPMLGGVNLEDIAAPRCFAIERALQERLEIPVMHDDQHGTAIVVLAGLMNAALVCGAELAQLRVVIVGAGAAGSATARLLREAGVRDIAVCDRHGTLGPHRTDIDEEKAALVRDLELAPAARDLAAAVAGANVVIGLSGPGVIPVELLPTMARPRIVFALANPTPEVDPIAAAPHVDVLATGRSDHPNQVNNVLAFPGVFRGLLDARARRITTAMKVGAAHALAGCVPPRLRSAEYILPSVFDGHVVPAVARSVGTIARATGLARRDGRQRSYDRGGNVR